MNYHSSMSNVVLKLDHSNGLEFTLCLYQQNIKTTSTLHPFGSTLKPHLHIILCQQVGIMGLACVTTSKTHYYQQLMILVGFKPRNFGSLCLNSTTRPSCLPLNTMGYSRWILHPPPWKTCVNGRLPVGNEIQFQ